jgi:hypothetical protein
MSDSLSRVFLADHRNKTAVETGAFALVFHSNSSSPSSTSFKLWKLSTSKEPLLWFPSLLAHESLRSSLGQSNTRFLTVERSPRFYDFHQWLEVLL